MQKVLSTAAALLACALAAPLASAQDAKPAAPPPASFSADECAVWARELSFAESIERHDAKAFAEHVHPGAVFSAKRPHPTRGRDAIVRQWAGLIDGTAVKLWWYPTAVAIGGEGDVAYSSGPALYESVDPKATQQHSIGGFQSVWHKDADGTWRVLFDDGVQPKPATEAEVAAFRANRKACPVR